MDVCAGAVPERRMGRWEAGMSAAGHADIIDATRMAAGSAAMTGASFMWTGRSTMTSVMSTKRETDHEESKEEKAGAV